MYRNHHKRTKLTNKKKCQIILFDQKAAYVRSFVRWRSIHLSHVHLMDCTRWTLTILDAMYHVQWTIMHHGQCLFFDYFCFFVYFKRLVLYLSLMLHASKDSIVSRICIFFKHLEHNLNSIICVFERTFHCKRTNWCIFFILSTQVNC